MVNTERRVKLINIVFLSLILLLAIILAARFVQCGGCGVCYGKSLANQVMLHALGVVLFGYIVSIPVMIYKVRQSKKISDDDCDEGSCSY